MNYDSLKGKVFGKQGVVTDAKSVILGCDVLGCCPRKGIYRFKGGFGRMEPEVVRSGYNSKRVGKPRFVVVSQKILRLL